MSDISEAMLEWYDQNARSLPWRIPPEMSKEGIKPNPYHIWLSEIMLQQTTVATVIDYYHKFLKYFPTVNHLADADIDDVMRLWSGLGYYSRARNLHKTAQIIVKEYNSSFPDDIDHLKSLPGIGNYTASAIASIAFHQSQAVVDGNIERIISRLYRIQKPLPDSKKEISHYASRLTPIYRAGDYAQSLMDLGSGICTPKNTLCSQCPISNVCEAYKFDDILKYPIKKPKQEKPKKYGIAYIILNNEKQILFEKRPQKGLFGGLYVLPYCDDMKEHQLNKKLYLKSYNNININCNYYFLGKVKHVFTHFSLHLHLVVCRENNIEFNQQQKWISIDNLSEYAFPTLVKKILVVFMQNKKENILF